MDIGASLRETTDTIFGFIPHLLGFLLVLLIGFIVAKLVASAVGKLLDKIGVDRKLKESDASRYADAVLPGASPSRGIARVAFWLIFFFFLISAVGALQLPTATEFMNRVLGFLPNIVVAILIFVVAALISGAVAGGVGKLMGDTPTGKVLASIVPGLIMVIAFFMILEQLQIAPEIVRIAFAAVMFALALGLALAFGLGGRDVAANLLQQAQDKGSDAADQARRDLDKGRDRGEQAAREGKERAEQEVNDRSGASSSTGGHTAEGSSYRTGTDSPRPYTGGSTS